MRKIIGWKGTCIDHEIAKVGDEIAYRNSLGHHKSGFVTWINPSRENIIVDEYGEGKEENIYMSMVREIIK